MGPSHLNTIRKWISENLPVQSSFFEESLQSLSPDERKKLDELLQFYVEKGSSPEHLAECYQAIVEDTVAEQIYFRRHNHYRFSTYGEVIDSGFTSPEYGEKYFKGLALTQYLWPNHRQLLRFFSKHLPHHSTGKYLEIGPGHGLFMEEALRSGSFSEYVALDVHETSIRLTKELLHRNSAGKKVNYVKGDIQNWATDLTFEAIVMGEVLEHTEDPQAVLKKVKGLSAPSGFIYLSTCMNTPARDHLWLFRTADEVRKLVEKTGLKISHEILIPYFKKTVQESEANFLPMNIGLILTHDH